MNNSSKTKRRSLPISRVRTRGGFKYFDHGQKLTDPALIDRINSLAIPPAWEKVEIARGGSSQVQARGVDEAGRAQIIYHQAFRAKQDAAKFDKLVAFGHALEPLRQRVAADLSRSTICREKVVACAVRLMDQHLLRVGNEQYARKYQSYGATTLRRKHVTVNAHSLDLSFPGKSGITHQLHITDPQLLGFIAELRQMQGYEIFRFPDPQGKLQSVRANHVNDYLGEYLGETLTAKDFRTWGGTRAAFEILLQQGADERLSDAVQGAAQKLGNTTAIARSSYIAPQVIDLAQDEERLSALRRSVSHTKTREFFDSYDICLLNFLEHPNP
ncbi:DNA topoisomerase IB [Glutamicibacter ardleyensis]|uniref:DNA topoisomerase IB n=1 Tax=Glutamicibacter ardleyensis TaxID=225894 RepID=UPI003FB6B2BC